MRLAKIIGAIITLCAIPWGCGSVTLAPEDFASGVADSGFLSSKADAMATSAETGLTNPVPTDAETFDGGIDVSETDAHDADSDMETHPSIDTTVNPCSPGTCYPRSDPQHTSCPCHY
jgi:hypothetical protein